MGNQEVCEVTHVHEDKVELVRKRLEATNVVEVAKFFKALSDDTRMKITYVLYQEEELCVCDIASIINSSAATASHHLRMLRDLGLAKSRKIGKEVYYSLDDDHVKDLIKIAFEHRQEVEDREKK